MTTLPPPPPPGLIVMYHYVRPDRAPIPAGIRPLLVSEFERQLDWLSERYDLVSAETFLQRTCPARQGRSPAAPAPVLLQKSPDTLFPPLSKTTGGEFAVLRPWREMRLPSTKPPCLLSFDDGTKDHAQIVTPILARRGLSGVFFVLSGPARHGQMPLTHAMHWLLSADEQAVWDAFQRYARDHLYGLDALGNPAEARRMYHYETPTRALIKYAANMAFPSEATEAIVESAARAAGQTMRELAGEWFVGGDDIRTMDAAGMTIAAHGRSHRSLQSLGSAGIGEEIRHCSDYIKSLLRRRPTWYACPFGGSGASLTEVNAMRDAMTESGIVASVSTVKRHVEPGADPLSLPRFDTIDLPPRRADAIAA